jgi:phospholipid/cholesterol/gamma-HCH transport system substrate-binding protein
VRPKLTDFRAGLLAIALTVFGVYVAFAGGLPFLSHPYTIWAEVRSANELHSRTPVRIAGVGVGHVAGFKRGPGGTALIKLAINDNGLPIHRDATLKVRPRIFLEGNFFVDLKPGSPESPVLHAGGVIPLAQTATPVQLDQILATLDSPTRADLLHFIHGLAGAFEKGGAQAFDRTLRYWPPVFKNGAITAQALRGLRNGDLARFVRDEGDTAAAIAADRVALADLVTGLNRSARALAQRRAKVEASLSQLAGLVDVARPTFHAVDAAIPSTRALARAVRPSLRSAPPALRDANLLLDQVDALTRPAELPALLDQLDPAVVQLAKLEPQLRELLTLARPVTECLRTNAVPTLKKKIDDGPLSTGLPAYKELLSSIVGLASASQNFDGNGTALRYHAGFGDEQVSLGQANPEGPLVGLTSQPILGSRPAYTGVAPPFRPDVPCGQNQPPNMAAKTGPAPQQQQVAP